MRTQSILKTALLLALPAALVFTACDPTALQGNGDLITETRSVSGFDGLNISVPGEVHITSGSTFKVEVTAEENLMPYLETDVRSGKLHIYFSRNVRDVDGLRVDITMPELTFVQLTGSANLHSHQAFTGNALELEVTGSGEVNLEQLDFESIQTTLSGSGTITISGIANKLDADLSGSGEINAFQCPVKNAEVHVSGSGMARVNATQKLVAYISGSGHVQYKGDPAVEKHISGSGSIVKK